MTNLIAKAWSLAKTWYGFWLIVTIFCQIIFVFKLVNGLGSHVGGVERGLSGFLMFSVYILVFLNTIHFGGQVLPVVFKAEDYLKSNANGKFKSEYGFISFSLYFSVAICGVLAVLILLAWFNWLRLDLWRLMTQINEIGIIITFFVFLITDSDCLEICKRALAITTLSKEQRSDLEVESKQLEKFILGVDLPGLFGLILIALFSNLIYPGKVVDVNTASFAYWQGFTTGAIALHITFSQAALAFLSTAKK